MQRRRPYRLFTGLLCWPACASDGFLLWFESIRAGPRWLLAVPIEEFADLGVPKAFVFFSHSPGKGTKFVRNRRKVRMPRLLVCLANAAVIVSSGRPRKLFYLRRVEMAHRDNLHSDASMFI
jgi:hypothetical protein